LPAKTTKPALFRKEMSFYLGGKPSPRTIFNVEMVSPREQSQETLRLLRAFLKLEPQVTTLPAQAMGLRKG
jgi:hypothetical protein